jgi:hypothetical protein
MTKLEMCRAAIVAFWVAFYKVVGFPFNMEKAERYLNDAEYLLTESDEGLRYGAPGWPHLKLHFNSERGFWLESNGMDLEDFLGFQGYVASEFERNGLPFQHMDV